MKILHLVLYSKDPYYDEMFSITSAYYQKFSNITTLYYLFDPSLSTDYKLEGDVLYIKGTESLVPGVLRKTILAFEYVSKNYNLYDYVIRSNISTIIDFTRIIPILESSLKEYYGIQNLVGGINKKYGIVNFKYHLQKYASGISMIYKRELFLEILKNKDKLDYSVIDDVALGILVTKLGRNLHSLSGYAACVRNTYDIINICKDFIIFRNCNSDRKIDIENMKKIVNQLTKNLV